mgnify:CR=1 FL=1
MGSQSSSSTEVSVLTLDSRQPNGLSRSAEPSRSGNHQPRGHMITARIDDGLHAGAHLDAAARVSIQHQSPRTMPSSSAFSGLM